MGRVYEGLREVQGAYPRVSEILNQWHEAHRQDFIRAEYSLEYFDVREEKHAHVGGKYIRLDVGTSGAWMLEISTGIIYGIKGYGTPDKKKIAGNLNDPSFNGGVLFRDRFRHGRFDNRTQSQVFDTSTVEGLEAAEKFKAQMEDTHDKVVTIPVGLNRVMIEGRN